MRKRIPHILDRPSKVTMPKHVIFYDTETNEKSTDKKTKVLTLRLGHAIHCRIDNRGAFSTVSEHSFTDRGSFNSWLLKEVKERVTVYVVAHNIAFDLRITGTMKYLSRKGWDRLTLIEDGINFMATYKKGRFIIKFINNQQLFNVSLRKLGESIGTYKGKVDFAHSTSEELLEYCKQDVRVMRDAWQILVSYVRENNLGSFKFTSASQAFGAYRHRFNKTDIHIHADERAVGLERESYHGGRVECHFIGTYNAGKVYCLDINGMYPHVMRESVPTKLLKYYGRSNLRQFTALREKYAYVADVTLDIATPSLPVKLISGRLCFPTGRVSGVFTKPELEYALRSARLLSVSRLAIYEDAEVFKEFVEYFYEKRQQFKREGNQSFAYLSKIMMNSLYGKFAQRQVEYVRIGNTNTIPDGIYKTTSDGSGRSYKLRILDGIIEKETVVGEGYNSFVAIASYITARARVYLDTLIERAGRKNVLYVDTDSLFVTEEGWHRLSEYCDDAALGMLKLLGVEDAFTVFAPKFYRFGDKSVHKGIRDNAIAIDATTFEQDKFMGFRSALRAKNLNGVTVSRVLKRVSHIYSKGTVLPDGFVLPFLSPQFPDLTG